MKRREQLLTRPPEGVHSDPYDEEIFALPYGQHHHLRAGFICGKMDDRPGSTKLTPLHTSCCHECEAPSARLRRCQQASSLDRHRSLTMPEAWSICITKHRPMAKFATTDSVGNTRQPMSTAMGIRFTRGIASVALAFIRHVRDRCPAGFWLHQQSHDFLYPSPELKRLCGFGKYIRRCGSARRAIVVGPGPIRTIDS
jgi:hypothetical protein